MPLVPEHADALQGGRRAAVVEHPLLDEHRGRGRAALPEQPEGAVAEIVRGRREAEPEAAAARADDEVARRPLVEVRQQSAAGRRELGREPGPRHLAGSARQPLDPRRGPAGRPDDPRLERASAPAEEREGAAVGRPVGPAVVPRRGREAPRRPVEAREPHVGAAVAETREGEAVARGVPVGRACLPEGVVHELGLASRRGDRPEVEGALGVGGERDPPAVRRPRRLAVVGGPAREPHRARTVDAGAEEVVIALGAARPDDLRAVGRPGRLHVLAARRPREPPERARRDVDDVELPVAAPGAAEREPPAGRRDGEVGIPRLQPRDRRGARPVGEHRARLDGVDDDQGGPVAGGRDPSRARDVDRDERHGDEERE